MNILVLNIGLKTVQHSPPCSPPPPLLSPSFPLPTPKSVGQTDHQSPTSALQYSFFKKKILFIYFKREGKGGRKRWRETSMFERNISWLPIANSQQRGLAHNPGTSPRGESNYPLVYGTMPRPLSHTVWGYSILVTPVVYQKGPN